jgi:hypothetical protein
VRNKALTLWSNGLWNALGAIRAVLRGLAGFRVAEIHYVAKVALEAGNSAQIIFQHYRELVRPKEAKEWFEIKPESGK